MFPGQVPMIGDQRIPRRLGAWPRRHHRHARREVLSVRPGRVVAEDHLQAPRQVRDRWLRAVNRAGPPRWPRSPRKDGGLVYVDGWGGGWSNDLSCELRKLLEDVATKMPAVSWAEECGLCRASARRRDRISRLDRRRKLRHASFKAIREREDGARIFARLRFYASSPSSLPGTKPKVVSQSSNNIGRATRCMVS